MRIDAELSALLASLEQHHALPTIALGVDRVLACLERLRNPQLHLPPVVHIAGTNGKGSTLAMLRALLEDQGLRVHCYTSPHLVRFHERIVLAGKEIESRVLLDALKRVQEAASDDIPLTFFEATTIAAFVCFAEYPADIVLLEVGLGGRLDATNVIGAPLACVITPIDYDHKEFLGDTLEQIAMEKAGIMKAEVPVISAVQKEEVQKVLNSHAKALHAPLLYAHVESPPGIISLQGEHQQVNAACAVAVYRAIRKPLGLPPENLDALQRAVWRGRLQRLTQGPSFDVFTGEVWLDGGHNPAAAKVLADWIREGPVTGLVIGMMQRKDIEGFLRYFREFDCPVAAVTIADAADAAPPEAIADVARALGFSHVAALPTLGDSMRWHCGASAPDINRILICGSLYLAGKVLQNHA